jgi:hypothetical protein
MIISERIQALIHKLEVEAGAKWLNYLTLALVVVALGVWYDTHCYHNFSSPEAMDAAQVARNLAQGKGFSTELVRPFSIYLLQKHNAGLMAAKASGATNADPAEVYGLHPDLANAPLYPAVLAGLFKVTGPDWKLDLRHTFWSNAGHFLRYRPEFIVAVFNQILLIILVLMTFRLTKTILDGPAAWLAAILVFCSDTLWRLSVSGLPTLLEMVLFLGLAWCLASFESLNRAPAPDPRRRLLLALLAGFLVGLGMLTRYSFGWAIVPVIVFMALFGGDRKPVVIAATCLIFALTVSPWIARNYMVSGTPFGTAGYAIAEGTSTYSDSRLMQSLSPNMENLSIFGLMPYVHKLVFNGRYGLQEFVPKVGGGWMGILFIAGLLLVLKSDVARRLRYFTLVSLGVFLVVTALGQTGLSSLSPDANTENLLVLLTPLAVIFGVAFFLTLLDQINFPSLPIRYVSIGLMVLLVRLPFVLTLLPPKTPVVAWPPYNAGDIGQICDWMEPNEMVMSDIPWAVAWYGDRQCVWTTVNFSHEFVSMNDFIKPVNALYLSLETLDAKLTSECIDGPFDNWGNFALKAMSPGHHLPEQFPLTYSTKEITSGLFLADKRRW